MANNYTLGRGKIYFSRFKTGTQTPEGFRYVGNSPELSLTIEKEDLEHFSSDEGIREQDDSVPLSVTRTGNFSTDNVHPENMALFFFGTKSIITQAVVASAPETLTDVLVGMSYQLGLTPTNPVGARGINSSGFSVAVGATPMTAGDDYTIDLDTGMLSILEGGAINDGDDVVVTYAIRASERPRVISGSSPVEGAMRYIAANPKGTNFDYIFPWIKVNPNGDFALKAEEWQVIPFTFQALKPTDAEAIYMDGRPAYS